MMLQSLCISIQIDEYGCSLWSLQGVAELKSELLEVASKQSYMGESIPQVWLNIENSIIE